MTPPTQTSLTATEFSFERFIPYISMYMEMQNFFHFHQDVDCLSATEEIWPELFPIDFSQFTDNSWSINRMEAGNSSSLFCPLANVMCFHTIEWWYGGIHSCWGRLPSWNAFTSPHRHPTIKNSSIIIESIDALQEDCGDKIVFGNSNALIGQPCIRLPQRAFQHLDCRSQHSSNI